MLSWPNDVTDQAVCPREARVPTCKSHYGSKKTVGR